MASQSVGQCPFADRTRLNPRDNAQGSSSRQHMEQYDVHDGDGYMTSDVGGPITEQRSLKVGDRGPTLLEDWIFRQKIMHFDHERVPERAVHARGAGAYGTFTSYGDFSNVTAASFLGAEGKETPTFVRFSTVVGSRGSADTARDVHGFATRFFTDEGNFDIVGNNIPVFFIQDAIQFPDLIHSAKPMPDSEIPQAATAHDSAWDFFMKQTTALHTMSWAMSGHGIPRSFRHMDGFGVNTFRFVNDKGEAKLIKWHWKTMQGRASLVWEEAQVAAGVNPDYHRQDLWEAIESGNYPEWELCAQIFTEEEAANFGFDVLDATKIIPQELVPLTKLGKMRLDANPVNFFSETEQIMFQPAHVVRGIDFSEDPLLQGRLFSYLDTQLNRNNGPNFEQLPINRPIVPVRNNNRDGFSQHVIHRNVAPYSPNTLNNDLPKQANQTQGRGFFTAPGRRANGAYTREDSPTFADHWSQPRLFYNSLPKEEQQQLINAIRFETSNVKSDTVRKNVIKELNKVDNDIAARVATALGMDIPEPDPTYYHNNKTTDVATLGEPLKRIGGLKVGVFASVSSEESLKQAADLKEQLNKEGVKTIILAERLGEGVDVPYTGIRASGFDGAVVAQGAERVFDPKVVSALYPNRRPSQTLEDAYRWGKPIAAIGSGATAYTHTMVEEGPGVFAANDTGSVVNFLKDGLKQFKYANRFPLDNPDQQGANVTK